MLKKILLSLVAGGSLAAVSQMASIAAGDVYSNVPEALAEGYEILYELHPPVNGGFRDGEPVPYEIDNSPNAPAFDRVAYYLELTNGGGTHWVYASMDAFTHDPRRLGLPHNRNNPVVHQRTVQNMNVASNVGGVVTGAFIDTGNIEMWPSDYYPPNLNGVLAASDEVYDWGDGEAHAGAGYGSFQVHNAGARQTVLAYNRWGLGDEEHDDIGIGNADFYHPDWTFTANAGHYFERKLVILVRPRTHQISLTQLPRDRQLYSRDPATNLATVPISGQESFGGFSRIVLRIMRDGALHSETDQALNYRSGRASFSFEPEITAELAKYDFELLLEKGGELRTVERVNGVVAGDAYLFYGQSNAEAQRYDNHRSANEYASEWLLTFGQNGDSGAHAENILYWMQAEGDGDRDTPGAIGQWAMVLGRKLIDDNHIPIAILNGARGGYSMEQLQKDRSQPDNLDDSGGVTRTYNRLRHRAIEAGVNQTARAMFFYQGEAEGHDAKLHADGFARMRQDWNADYPGLEQIYVTQIRPGCGVSAESVDLRDTQRRFADVYPNTSVMASNGLDSHDGCHFQFTSGYEDLGVHHFRVVQRDLYGAPHDPNIDPLNPAFVEFTDANRTDIRLVLRNVGATVHFPHGALDDFVLSGSSAAITGRTVSGRTIVFHLNEPASEESVLEYRAHLGNGEWVTNGAGVGMLSFAEPVRPHHFLGLPAGGGMRESSWFGRLDDRYFDSETNAGWLRHAEHGWLYAVNRAEIDGFWAWDHIQQDWLWTRGDVYPFLYRHNEGHGHWVYYWQGGKPNERHFYDYNEGQWIQAP